MPCLHRAIHTAVPLPCSHACACCSQAPHGSPRRRSHDASRQQAKPPEHADPGHGRCAPASLHAPPPPLFPTSCHTAALLSTSVRRHSQPAHRCDGPALPQTGCGCDRPAKAAAAPAVPSHRPPALSVMPSCLPPAVRVSRQHAHGWIFSSRTLLASVLRSLFLRALLLPPFDERAMPAPPLHCSTAAWHCCVLHDMMGQSVLRPGARRSCSTPCGPAQQHQWPPRLIASAVIPARSTAVCVCSARRWWRGRRLRAAALHAGRGARRHPGSP